MHVRLRVQRAHLAAVRSIDYWRASVIEAEEAREAIIKQESAKLLSKRTWCGGYKYNEQSARAYFEFGKGCHSFLEHYLWQKDSGLDAIDYTIEYRNKVVDWLTSFIRNTENKSGFMVILTEEQYGWIWTEV